MDPPTLETNDPSKMISSLGSKLIPTNATEIKLLQTLDTKYQLQSTQERIFSLNEKLKKITLSSSSSNSIGTKEEVNKDWTKTYEKWDQFIDRDEVIELKKKEEQDYESLLAKADNLGHVHNHTEEREFFQQPEHQKLEVCKGYRTLGNYFVYEGSFLEAIEAYETSIGYYEYCFPEEEENQKELDDIRVACFLNVSMCYLRVKEFRKAIESASNAIRETKELNPKAFYRRGQAYRCLDDYENAKTDLEKALKIVPKDKMILEELKLLKVRHYAILLIDCSSVIILLIDFRRRS